MSNFSLYLSTASPSATPRIVLPSLYDVTDSFVDILRGLVGTVLVYKIAGAMAKTGASLDEIYSVSEWVAQNVASIGVGLEHCHVSVSYLPLTSALVSITFEPRRFLAQQLQNRTSMMARSKSAWAFTTNPERNAFLPCPPCTI